MDFVIDKTLIGKRIKERREELNITQIDLGLSIGFDQQRISRFERGLHKPDLESLAKVAKALGVSLDWLIGLSDEDES